MMVTESILSSEEAISELFKNWVAKLFLNRKSCLLVIPDTPAGGRLLDLHNKVIGPGNQTILSDNLKALEWDSTTIPDKILVLSADESWDNEEQFTEFFETYFPESSVTALNIFEPGSV